MIRKCKANCRHKAQDELHGPGIRVLNHVPAKEKGKVDEYRCTVCGTVHAAPPASPTKES